MVRFILYVPRSLSVVTRLLIPYVDFPLIRPKTLPAKTRSPNLYVFGVSPLFRFTLRSYPLIAYVFCISGGRHTTKGVRGRTRGIDSMHPSNWQNGQCPQRSRQMPVRI